MLVRGEWELTLQRSDYAVPTADLERWNSQTWRQVSLDLM